MKIENPFENGHIKNYLLLYASVVVIMVLFFLASTLFNDAKSIQKKVFTTDAKSTLEDKRVKNIEDNSQNKTLKSKLKLMDRSY